MNVLFLTLARITDINERGIYTDLMRKFRDEGHGVVIVSPSERRFHEKTNLTSRDGIQILQVWTFNIQKNNVIEKGLGTVLLEFQFLRAVKKYLCQIKFDLVIFSTPPITLAKIIRFIKKKDSAVSYLLLKDIFPQNAVDLGMISPHGLLHRHFRQKEKKLYSISDIIGCMSPANEEYLLKHNPEIDHSKVEVCPNSIEPAESFLSEDKKKEILTLYHIPADKTTFIYGGNLGKPQGVDFVMEVLDSNRDNAKVFFVVIGSGTEYPKLKSWFEQYHPENAILLSGLPKDEYDRIVQACDVGMIFLDERFTIPNYPSRLLSYLEYKMPVIAVTDPHSDLGKRAEENGYGLWSLSGDIVQTNKNIARLASDRNLITEMGEKGYRFLLKNYTVEHSYRIIMRHFKDN